MRRERTAGMPRLSRFSFFGRKINRCPIYVTIRVKAFRMGGERMDTDEQLMHVSKVIFSFCRARTATIQDAEDLSQDVMLELTRSLPNLRDERAFYGFMWSVARHVYGQWLRRRRLHPEAERPDLPAPEEDDGSDLHLLRRELALLGEKYRRVTVLYYMRGLSCAAIAADLAISESMVKYLLFKARIKLKEGMNMERNLGQQSYDPRRLELNYWSNEPARYYPRKDELISQNILFACYNDKLTAEEISLEIGVGLPYMEKDLDELAEYELLIRDGKRYTTNIVLFTHDMGREITMKSADSQRRIAALVREAVASQEVAIRRIGFAGADMPGNTFAWQMTAWLLYQGAIAKLEEQAALIFPCNKLGQRYFVWGVETDTNAPENGFAFGTSEMVTERGDHMRCMDFPVNGEMVHPYFARHGDALLLLMDVATGRVREMSESDELRAAEMVRYGYLTRVGGKLTVNAPVLTRAQYEALLALLNPTAEAIAAEAGSLMRVIAEIMRNHLPAHLRNQANAMAYFRLHKDAVSMPAAVLVGEKFLLTAEHDSMLPTAYVVINQ